MFVGVDHIWVVPSISNYFANNIINLKELDCAERRSIDGPCCEFDVSIRSEL
jgi:hypothetical protein